MFPENAFVGIEAMAYKARENFYPQLVSKFQHILDHVDLSIPRRVLDSNIPKLVEGEFGLNVILSIEKSTQYGAYMIAPDLKRNHSLLASWRNTYSDAGAALKYLKSSKLKAINGSVSRATGKVYGDFTKIHAPIVFSEALFDGTFTARELASMFSHELGHFWTYLECLARTVTCNLALAAVLQELSGTQDVKMNFQLITELENVTGTKVPNAKQVANYRSTEKLHTVVVNEVYKQTVSSTEYGSLYDQAGWESQSDMFVSRLGGGKDLTTALHKIHKKYGDPAYWGATGWYIWQILSVALTLVVTWPILLAVFFVLALSGTHPETNEYDTIAARCNRIKLDIVGSLRNKGLAKEEVKQTLADIDEIEAALENAVDRQPWLTGLMVVVWNPFRKQAKEKQMQQLLEELANNPLLITAARFKAADY